jgi:uncharacterized membrane protein YdjX (TVP38/TMEM64 family)
VSGENPARRRTMAIVIVVPLLVAAAGWRMIPLHVLGHMDGTFRLVRDFGLVGSVVFAMVQMVIAVSGVLPASLLGVAAGALYGPLVGFALTALGTLGGAWLAFVLARSAWRPVIARQVHRRQRLHAFDCRVATAGWRLVMLLRLSPVMPFALTSYALGLSGVGRRDYLLGTLACLPALFGYVLIGVLSGTGLAQPTDGGGLLRAVLLAVGAAATLALTMWIGRLAAAVLRAAPDAVSRHAG